MWHRRADQRRRDRLADARDGDDRAGSRPPGPCWPSLPRDSRQSPRRATHITPPVPEPEQRLEELQMLSRNDGPVEPCASARSRPRAREIASSCRRHEAHDRSRESTPAGSLPAPASPASATTCGISPLLVAMTATPRPSPRSTCGRTVPAIWLGGLARRAQHHMAFIHRGTSPCGTPVTTCTRSDVRRRKCPQLGLQRTAAHKERVPRRLDRLQSAVSIDGPFSGTNRPTKPTIRTSSAQPSRPAISVAAIGVGAKATVSTPGGITRDGVSIDPPVVASMASRTVSPNAIQPSVRPSTGARRRSAATDTSCRGSETTRRRTRRDRGRSGDLRGRKHERLLPTVHDVPVAFRTVGRCAYHIRCGLRSKRDRLQAAASTPRRRSARSRSVACRRETCSGATTVTSNGPSPAAPFRARADGCSRRRTSGRSSAAAACAQAPRCRPLRPRRRIRRLRRAQRLPGCNRPPRHRTAIGATTSGRPADELAQQATPSPRDRRIFQPGASGNRARSATGSIQIARLIGSL